MTGVRHRTRRSITLLVSGLAIAMTVCSIWVFLNGFHRTYSSGAFRGVAIGESKEAVLSGLMELPDLQGVRAEDTGTFYPFDRLRLGGSESSFAARLMRSDEWSASPSVGHEFLRFDFAGDVLVSTRYSRYFSG